MKRKLLGHAIMLAFLGVAFVASYPLPDPWRIPTLFVFSVIAGAATSVVHRAIERRLG